MTGEREQARSLQKADDLKRYLYRIGQDAKRRTDRYLEIIEEFNGTDSAEIVKHFTSEFYGAAQQAMTIESWIQDLEPHDGGSDASHIRMGKHTLYELLGYAQRDQEAKDD